MARSTGVPAALLAVLFAVLALAPSLAPAAGDADVAAYRRAVEKSFAEWLQQIWPDAEAAGVSRATFDANLKGLKLNWLLPHLVLPDPASPGGPALPPALAKAMAPKHQPEFDAPVLYFPASTLNALSATGRAKIAQLGPTLAAIQKKYGVPASIVVAIWGRETGFGTIDAPYDAISTVATQGFMGRRPDEFRTQLIAALKIVDEGHASRAQLKSSWAGAMGYTQFMPTDFEKYAVDGDGDGKPDIWNSIPDSLASTANSLKTQGWDGSKSWGYEVQLPQGFDCALQGPDKARPVAEWMKLGVGRVGGQAFPQNTLDDFGLPRAAGGAEGPCVSRHRQFLGAEALQQLRRLRDFRRARRRHDREQCAGEVRRRLAAGGAAAA